MVRQTLTLTLLIFISTSAFSQQIIEQEVIWLRYFNKLNFNDQVALHTEFEERRYLNPDRIHQRFLPRMGLNYSASEKVSFNLGFTYFQFFTPNDPTITPLERHEYRPHQYIKLSQSFGRLNVSQRYMLEQRWLQTQPGAGQEYEFGFRGRHLTTLTYLLAENLWKNEAGKVKLVVYDEVMFQLGEIVNKNIFDQNRFFVGTQIDFGPRLGSEIGVFNWFQQLPPGDSYFSRYIARISLFHTINL